MRPTINVAGFPLKSLIPLGVASAGFGGVALIAVLYFAEGIPRVQNDVLKKIPLVGNYYASKKPIPASDSPF
ncbi:hypothetical protein K440DRAFT_613742 [Wilcoxina mikolae CBS 423.85]|nr:hypothetical protein K440DRAFT_613742 [Wilcoxina mikolae CBS 423.85]